MTEWQDISTAPKDGTWVIGANGETPTRPMRWVDNAFKVPHYHKGELIEFMANCTHWVPLPSPPKT